MFTHRRSFLPGTIVVWIVVGVVVAAIYDYFDSLKTVGQVLTAIAAVLLWPLLFFGFDIQISR
jgi:ABC-type Na+ efflux pump permease subunit